jgi:endonuclease III
VKPAKLEVKSETDPGALVAGTDPGALVAGTDPVTLERLTEVAARLLRRYGRHAPAPTSSHDDPIEGLIETILSQQNVGIVTRRMYAALKTAFPNWEIALLAGPDVITHVLEASGGGLSRIKAGYIHRALTTILEVRGNLSLEFLRALPDRDVRDFLESLPGVGPKTASCVLMFDLERPAMPVDTHVHRIAKRLEFVAANSSASQAEAWFDTNLARDWAGRYEFHVNAFEHGRATCRSQRPRCRECVLEDLCPSAIG